MKKLEIAFCLFLIFWITDTAFTQNVRRNGTTTTSRPVSRRGTQRITASKRTRNPSISPHSTTTTTPTTTSSTSTSTTTTTPSATTAALTTTPEPTTSTFESLSTTELSVTITSEGNISSLKSPSSTKATLTAVLVMIVEMRANESLIDQIENSRLNISSKANQESRFGSGVSFPVRKSAKPLASDVAEHETAIDLSNDLTGHESRPPAELKYVNASKTPQSVLAYEKCWIDGGIACKESRLMCSGFGDIDCRAGECTTSPTLICNMDLGKAKCSGYGSCKKQIPATEITATPSLSTMATIIVVVSISLGVLVLAGTTIYVYLSTSKHKVRPETDSSRSNSSSSRMDMMNRLGCLGANVYHQ